MGVAGRVIVSVIQAPPSGDLAVSSYERALYENGTLQEQYIYNVQSSGYTGCLRGNVPRSPSQPGANRFFFF